MSCKHEWRCVESYDNISGDTDYIFYCIYCLKLTRKDSLSITSDAPHVVGDDK